MKGQSRRSDFIAHVGGDEFTLILSNTPVEGVRVHLEQLSKECPGVQKSAPLKDGYKCCTLSRGAAYVDPESDHTPADILKRSDRALHQAKESGRGRIEITAPTWLDRDPPGKLCEEENEHSEHHGNNNSSFFENVFIGIEGLGLADSVEKVAVWMKAVAAASHLARGGLVEVPSLVQMMGFIG